MAGRHFLSVLFLVLLTFGSAVHAADLETSLSSMLDVAWKPSIKGFQTAKTEYDALIQQSPGDVRVKYAFALVLMKNRRYDEATKLLGDILNADKTHVPARRARAWIAVLTKKYTAALVDLDQLSQQLPPETTGDDEAQWRSIAGFIGRMFGYLEGPAEAAVADHVLADYQTKICARLAGTRLAAYNTGFREVDARFAGLSQSEEQTKADAKVQATEQKEREKKDLDESREQIANENAAIKAQAEKLQADERKEISALEVKALPLQNNLSRLQSQALGLSNQMAVLEGDLAVITSLINRTRDPLERDRLRAQATGVSINLNGLGVNLGNLNANIANVNGQLGALEAERRAVIGRYDAELGRLGGRQVDLQKAGKRLTADERRLREPITGNTPRSRAISATAAALTTYDEFPFEQERERLLKR